MPKFEITGKENLYINVGASGEWGGGGCTKFNLAYGTQLSYKWP